jgi:WD40 repeat protein
MYLSKSISAEHKDIIQDVAYNFHGKRMATCSCDQQVKIWDLIDGEWKCTASWRAHSASVFRVAWAHPEFGQVIATCSFDHTAAIWEELPENTSYRWVKRSILVDSRSSISDVQFGPKRLGLVVATCAVDGVVRVYEATDVMNLGSWNLQAEIQTKIVCSCLSWSTAKSYPPLIAVGCDETVATSGRIQIYEFSEQARKWSKAETIATILDPVRDISFSPNLGRSFHMLAVASKDVHILSLKPLPRTEPSQEDDSVPVISRFEIRSIGQFGDHQSQVWRVSWNITGTILASSGDDGHVRLWKGNYMDNWKCIAELKGDAPDIQRPLSAITTSQPSVAVAAAATGDRSSTTTSRFVYSATKSASPPVWH